MSIVRQNLLKDPAYAPYCMTCSRMTRMSWTGSQFRCQCGAQTAFEPEFIERVIAFRQAATQS